MNKTKRVLNQSKNMSINLYTMCILDHAVHKLYIFKTMLKKKLFG